MNFHENVEVGLALLPQVVAAVAKSGATILEPWKKGRTLSFILLGGAMTTDDALTITLQGQKIADDSWAALTDLDGDTLTFTTTKTADAAALDSGSLIGSIPLSKIDGDTYKAVRIVAVNGVAQNVILGAAYVISDLYSAPSSMTDDLLSKVAQFATSE